jgi:3-deoxy-D-manno-octulosonic-acid transferase
MPVVFGPTWKKFREAHGLLNAGAAITVRNYREFANALDTAFATQHVMGQAATDYVNSELGATNKILKHLNL